MGDYDFRKPSMMDALSDDYRKPSMMDALSDDCKPRSNKPRMSEFLSQGSAVDDGRVMRGPSMMLDAWHNSKPSSSMFQASSGSLSAEDDDMYTYQTISSHKREDDFSADDEMNGASVPDEDDMNGAPAPDDILGENPPQFHIGCPSDDKAVRGVRRRTRRQSKYKLQRSSPRPSPQGEKSTESVYQNTTNTTESDSQISTPQAGQNEITNTSSFQSQEFYDANQSLDDDEQPGNEGALRTPEEETDSDEVVEETDSDEVVEETDSDEVVDDEAKLDEVEEAKLDEDEVVQEAKLEEDEVVKEAKLDEDEVVEDDEDESQAMMTPPEKEAEGSEERPNISMPMAVDPKKGVRKRLYIEPPPNPLAVRRSARIRKKKAREE